MWDDVLASEPRPWLTLHGPAIDVALGAIGAFSDLVSPDLSGHSSAVARIATSAATRQGFGPAEVQKIGRAALVHDVGRTAIDYRIWGKPGRLTIDEREQVRLHPYHTERVLAPSPFLSNLAPIAMAHHERLDGSGYHRGLDGSSLSRASRLLAVADAYQSKIEPRPYRDPLSPPEAIEMLVTKAEAGVLDPAMVMAVAEAAGEARPTVDQPAGLTEREVEVLGWVARGKTNSEIAATLFISPLTVRKHLENIFEKLGVRTRTAAAAHARTALPD